ncbi:hypothetical protein ACFSQ7_24695 [Paenibacillus rhizoplanae]
MIPNIFPQFIVYLSTGIASLILMVSSFSFLGLGFPAGTPEWGAMLSEARSSVYSHPLLLLYPGLCVLLAAAGFNLFGEALRDITTPEGGRRMTTLLEVRDLAIELRGTQQPIVKHSSFSLKQGSTLAIVGESGSGKKYDL